MIDKNKQYRTRDGREVRIYATDGDPIVPIHKAALGDKKECETCKHYSFKVWGVNRSVSGKCFGFGSPAKYVDSYDCCDRYEKERNNE